MGEVQIGSVHMGCSPIGGSPNEGGPVQAMTSSDDTQALVRQMK